MRFYWHLTHGIIQAAPKERVAFSYEDLCINIKPTILPKKIEDFREAVACRRLRHVQRSMFIAHQVGAFW